MQKPWNSKDYQFERGSVVTGKVETHESDGAYVDIGGKSAAFLPTKEASLESNVDLEEVLPIGTERKFLIIKDQDANGQMVISIRAMEIKALWDKLQERQENGDVIEVTVSGSNKGGVTADVSGLRAFIPRSHLARRVEDLDTLMGQTINVAFFLEVNPETEQAAALRARGSAFGRR